MNLLSYFISLSILGVTQQFKIKVAKLITKDMNDTNMLMIISFLP